MTVTEALPLLALLRVLFIKEEEEEEEGEEEEEEYSNAERMIFVS